MDGLAHVRVYEGPGQIPVVIAGQLDDNPGTHLTIGIEMAATSIHENLFPDGREFRLSPTSRETRSATHGSPSSNLRIAGLATTRRTYRITPARSFSSTTLGTRLGLLPACQRGAAIFAIRSGTSLTIPPSSSVVRCRLGRVGSTQSPRCLDPTAMPSERGSPQILGLYTISSERISKSKPASYRPAAGA